MALVQFSICSAYNSDVRVYWLIISVLSVWRVTHLFVAEDGPWNLFARLRQRVGEGFFATLLDCFYCLSLWISAPVAWFTGESLKERVLLWLAISGAAILVERVNKRSTENTSTFYYEDPEE
jgi:hypothetical protein